MTNLTAEEEKARNRTHSVHSLFIHETRRVFSFRKLVPRTRVRPVCGRARGRVRGREAYEVMGECVNGGV